MALRPAAQIQGFLRWTDKSYGAIKSASELLPLIVDHNVVGYLLPG